MAYSIRNYCHVTIKEKNMLAMNIEFANLKLLITALHFNKQKQHFGKLFISQHSLGRQYNVNNVQSAI